MILIVDDRPENILPLEKILNLHALETDTASSGEEALKKILRQNYSLIILDVQMPGMDGFEVAEAIGGYSKAKDIPVLFLSAVNTDKKFITQGYSSGAVDYVTKPVDPDVFILKVRTFLRLYEQQQELKKHKDELSRHMQELRTVLESLPTIAFTITPEGEIEYTNKLWFQYSDEVKRLPSPYPGEEEIYKRWEAAFNEGREFDSDLRIRNLYTQQFRYHHLRITPVRQDDEIVRWVGTYTDIHQQKLNTEVLEEQVEKRTEELMKKNEELENYNHELQQFTWVVSHDLKEPLRKIQTFNQMVKEKFLGDNEGAHRFIDRSIRASERLSRLIDNLLHYSRLSVKHEFQQTDLNVLFKELIEEFEDEIKRHNATVILKKLPVIDSIPGQLRQVFQNLLSNSLKFSRKDIKAEIRVSARVIKEDSEDYCEIEFKDNGIGFQDQYKERIFLIFQRLHANSEYEGTGIGLAIAKKIIDQHRGSIRAESIENQGAKFIVTLPIHQKKEDDEGNL